MASSPKEIQRRTEAMREHRKQSRTKYELTAGIDNSGISGSIEGTDVPFLIRFSFSGFNMALREDEVDTVMAFLSYAKNECIVMREHYERIREAA